MRFADPTCKFDGSQESLRSMCMEVRLVWITMTAGID